MQFKSWARQDLEHLNIHKSREFINLKLLSDWTVQQLETNKISYPVSEFIVSRWMREAGFRYAVHKKSYYVDRHEDEDVVSDRKTYLVNFFDAEKYEHCWMQLPRRKYIAMKMNGTLRTVQIKQEKDRKQMKPSLIDDISTKVDEYVEKQRIHFYKSEDNVDMVEMHVDDVYSYKENEGNLPLLPSLGGDLSVRIPIGEKPILWFGQDEAIYRSSQLNESCWTVDGESTLRTKGLGIGLMVSAMISRATGMGMLVTEEQLLEINKTRRGTKYIDQEAATYLNGNDLKKDLTESPFIRYLNYGSGKDGYWTYRHMVLQIEDCVDCLKYTHPDFRYGFELDHSSGHNSERPDGLSTNSINLGWGGKQRCMRNSVLTKDDIGTLKHNRTLKVGDIQSMVFDENDLPPILDPNAPKYDAVADGVIITRKLNKSELKTILELKGFNGNGSSADLIERAEEANISLTETKQKIVDGYVGKPKGAAQIACERGFLDDKGKLPNGTNAL